MLNPMMLRVFGSLFLLAIAFISGWKVCTWKYDSMQNKSKDEVINQVINQDKSSFETSKIRIEKQIVYQKSKDEDNKNVIKEIVKVPIYSDCIVPVSGVRLINSAISTANQIKSPS